MTDTPTSRPGSGLAAQEGQALIETIRAIVVGQERQRLEQLEAELLALEQRLHADDATAITRLHELAGEIQRLEARTEPAGLVDQLKPVMTGLVHQTIHDSPDEMAEALGPVMGEAIRVQIRDSRQGMVDAIAPIIGETVQKAISDFAREMQRNIDARLHTTFDLNGVLRNIQARLRGVSPAELAMREALPFAIQELFLIQRESGLLLAHLHPGSDQAGDQASDSDLISGMLTAIRDFVQDSFGQGRAENELDEVQYGEQSIIIQSGRYAYLAVVSTGVESPGFRARLHELVSNLHIQAGNRLRDYSGDSSTLPDLEDDLAELVRHPTVEIPDSGRSLTRNQRIAITGGLLTSVAALILCCFYAWFTYSLLPVAFTRPTTATATVTFTLLPTHTSTATITPSPIPTITPSTTPTATFSPVPPSATPVTPSATSMPAYIAAVALGDVWLRSGPSRESATLVAIRQGTPVYVFSAYGDWLEIEWSNQGKHHRGWATIEMFFMIEPMPPGMITPTTAP